MKNYTHFIDYNKYQGKFHETGTFKTCDLINSIGLHHHQPECIMKLATIEFHPPKKYRLTKLIRNNHLCH